MKKFLQTLGRRFATAGELIQSLWQMKLGWMIPVVFLLLLAGMLMIFAQASPLAPFIYTIF